jgi:hypothetical protein
VFAYVESLVLRCLLECYLDILKKQQQFYYQYLLSLLCNKSTTVLFLIHTKQTSLCLPLPPLGVCLPFNKSTCSFIQHIHCKKELAVFPSPAGMSLIKLFLGGNNLVFSRPERVWSVTSRLGTGKWLSLFYSVLFIQNTHFSMGGPPPPPRAGGGV